MDTSQIEDQEQYQIIKKLKIYQEEHQRLTTLLNITRNISQELELDNLLFTIMDEVKKALKADRCTVFLIDKDRNELWSKVAHGEKDIRFPLHLGIAGYVASTGEVLNIPDAYADPRFNYQIDKQTGYHTRNMLTFPMRNKFREIIGVFQVLNKHEGIFNKEDENLLDVISTIATSQLENALLYEEQKKTFESFVETLASTIDARDELTSGHSQRIAAYSMEIAKIINLPPKRQELLYYAALLHDYGKIAISEELLNKKGSLTIKEFCDMQEHPKITKRILEKINFSRDFKELPEIAAAHHEKIDGTGYPDGLLGNEIPLESKILAVVDVFDAMTSKRPYRDLDRMDFTDVMGVIDNGAEKHFDKEIVEAFKQVKINRLLEILERETHRKLNVEELEMLSHFTIQKLIDITLSSPVSTEEKRALKIFNRCYYRDYSKKIDEQYPPKIKVASS